MTEIDYLKKLYIEDLSAMVSYNGGNKRPRVRHPGNWERLEPQVRLNEGVDAPVTIPPTDDRNVWVWSDPHFFHKNIIEFSNRPYADINEMNEHIVANFNDYVGPNDISIWVGDVGFKGTGVINEILDQCNGYKILVVGNHDFDGRNLRKLNFDETHLIYKVDMPEVSLVFTHYPMHNIEQPWFNVHGHLHAYPKPDTGHLLHYNVCCELHEYKPVNLNEIAKIAKMRLISAEM